MGVTTVAYYVLRWFLIPPWSVGGQGVRHFFVVAIVWLVGTVIGGAVVGVVTRLIPVDRSMGNAVGVGVWLGVCGATVVAYLPSLWAAAAGEVAQGSGQNGVEWNSLAEAGSLFSLINALSALATVLIVIPWVGLSERSPRRIAAFLLTAVVVIAVAVPLLLLGTNVFDALTRGVY